MKRTFNRQRGYSLAELLVAVAVFALVILAALMIYDRSNRTFKLGVEASNVQQNTRVAFDKIVADLRMAGFDFDRDGIPTGSVGSGNQYQQTDEQFEFISPGAFTIRSNFDYESEKAPCVGAVTENCDNGREGTPLYESNQFPVVTTGNDELVTYALVPDSQTAKPACNPATNCVEFYADVALPRRSFPDPANGGQDEGVVRIPGVDLCVGGCNNPPYTLYRYTLARDQSNFTTGLNVTETPLATNIRSMTLTYYQDPQGTMPLMDLNNVTDVSTGEAILGKGQWKANNPGALVAERSIRSRVNSVRISLVGMSETRDPAYTDTAEPIASARNFRKYRLDTLVAPRNILRRGMREQDTFAPGPPQNVQVCTGACNGVWVTWDAPLVNAAYGAPDQYKVIYDVQGSTGFLCETTTFTNTFMHVAGSGSCALQSGQQYKFAVVALNSYGSAPSTIVNNVTVINDTLPEAPTLLTATNNLNGKVTLTWRRPMANVGGGGYSCASQPVIPHASELKGYKVWRSPQGAGAWTVVADENAVQSPYDVVTWSDTTAINCVPYDYRITAVEHCAAAANMNQGNNIALATSANSNVLSGQADPQGALPVAPSNLNIDLSASVNSCGVPPNPVGVCTVFLSWPKVTTDVNSAPITVGAYNIYRQQVSPVAGAWTQIGTQTTIPATGDVPYQDTVTYTGTERYEYRITATQCTPPLESAPSVQRPFPCFFPAGVVGTPMLSGIAFDGDGTAGYPWLVVNDAAVSVNVVSSATLQRMQARIYNQAGNLKTTQTLLPPDFRLTPTSPQYTFAWTVDNDATERIDVTAVDTGGCVRQDFAFVRDEAQSCCLTPLFADPSVQFYSPGSNFVDIILKNNCNEQLNIQDVHVTWNNGITPGGTKIDSLIFPASGGGTVAQSVPGGSGTNFTLSPPVTAAPVNPNQTNYRVRLMFSKNLTAAVSPITLFEVRYTQPATPTTPVLCNAVP